MPLYEIVTGILFFRILTTFFLHKFYLALMTFCVCLFFPPWSLPAGGMNHLLFLSLAFKECSWNVGMLGPYPNF